MTPMTRRSLLGVPFVFAGCGEASTYFGKTDPPGEQRLVYAIGGEPETIDPAKTAGGTETYIIPSLFESMVYPHPKTSKPLAGIATHYERDSTHTRFTFYLRGHRNPRGTRLPRIDSLPPEHAGQDNAGLSNKTRPDVYNLPARWSDGVRITAHDVVYSWRRAIDPSTASPYAAFLYYICNAEEINAGKRPVVDLGVSALDDYTVDVETHSPTPFFLELQEEPSYYVVPKHAVEAAKEGGANWTTPDRLVTGGAFVLKKWKPYDHVMLVPNPQYYDAAIVKLREIVLLPVVSGSTNLNIYKTGHADSLLGKVIAPAYVPLLRSKRDFEAAPAYWTMFYSINTTRPPFDNVLVRYALNMAIDKGAIATFLRAGQIAATGLLPPLEGYIGPNGLQVEVDDISYDVLSHNVIAARQLLERAGIRKLRIDMLYPAHPASQDVALILQQQWRNDLGANVVLDNQEQSVWIHNRNTLQYSGVAERGWWGDYLDPNTFLENFLSGPSVIGTGWSDRTFDRMLHAANSAPNVSERMAALADCERFLLRAMPILPLYYNVQTVLKKPYVRGLPSTRVDSIRFKYASIDTKWRPPR